MPNWLKNPEQVNRLYLEKANERLVAWINWAEEKLAGTNLKCFVTGGNDDAKEVVDTLNREAGERVIACEEKLVTLNDEGHTMVSLGYSNPTPWKTPREIEEPELARHIEAAFQGCGKLREGDLQHARASRELNPGYLPPTGHLHRSTHRDHIRRRTGAVWRWQPGCAGGDRTLPAVAFPARPHP